MNMSTINETREAELDYYVRCERDRANLAEERLAKAEALLLDATLVLTGYASPLRGKDGEAAYAFLQRVAPWVDAMEQR
jgi:hypothetical protein